MRIKARYVVGRIPLRISKYKWFRRQGAKSLREAEDIIEKQIAVDPKGVHNGKYYIDGPCKV